MRLSPRQWVYCFLAGVGWAGVAYLLGGRAMGPSIGSGLLASPVIGLLVGWLLQPAFENATGGRRWLVALASLYLGAVAFGLAIGIGRLASGVGAERSALAAVAEPVLAVLWGVTVTGFVLLLWPLGYFTHFLLEWIENR